MKTTLVWFRNDLRLEDHPALYHAVAESDAVVPVFIWAPGEESEWAPGAAQRWWLHRSLQTLGHRLQAAGSRLVLRHGPALATLRDLIAQTGAGALYWNLRRTPALQARDRALGRLLQQTGIATETFEAGLLHDPDAVRTTSGGAYHVFTPFWNRLKADLEVPPPLPAPALDAAKAPARWPTSEPLDALDLLTGDTSGLDDAWTPGEAAAHRLLDCFLDAALPDYDDARHRPAVEGTSRLSPYLQHGEIGPRQVWHAVSERAHGRKLRAAGEAFLRQLAWREFSYHLLHHYPETPTEPLREAFRAFPWRRDEEAFERWQQGRTGYPFVDAGLRQLHATGWMHNRARMIVASFLAKDLRLPWQDGARWFWHALVDADLACNTMGWQWAAGCGADAQPYFRIFNPVTQGTRYDPGGTYVRRWLPELAGVPDRYVHRPWRAPRHVLDAAGLTLGRDYPAPMVDHDEARRLALAAFQSLR